MVTDYSAAKAAFNNLAKALSKEFGPQNIRINTIDPGPVATDFWLASDGVAAKLAGPSAARRGRRPGHDAGQRSVRQHDGSGRDDRRRCGTHPLM
jgi:NAD(P)-dependent dehydrogenase (short-subunit alcohol dehydrogenase family)